MDAPLNCVQRPWQLVGILVFVLLLKLHEAASTNSTLVSTLVDVVVGGIGGGGVVLLLYW